MISEKSAKLFCGEDITTIENYDKAINDNTQVYDLHHKNEIELRKTAQELMDMGLYYNRPAHELVFLTHSEHALLHRKNMSDETKLKLSNCMKGKHPSYETRLKISKAGKARFSSPEERAKASKRQKARFSSPEERAKISASLTGKHPSYETRLKISKAGKARFSSLEERAKASKRQKARFSSLEERAKLSKATKGKPLPKSQWLTPDGSIVSMNISHVTRWHPDWQLLSNIPVDQI